VLLRLPLFPLQPANSLTYSNLYDARARLLVSPGFFLHCSPASKSLKNLQTSSFPQLARLYSLNRTHPQDKNAILLSMIPFLHIGPLAIPTFGLMVACAMLLAYFVLRADLSRRGIADKKSGEAETLIAAPCLAGFVGAKLYHLLESPSEFFADPVHLLLSPYGFAWFGGLLAGFATFALVAWRLVKRSAANGHTLSVLTIFDAGSPAAALGYGIGRIGCFLSGDGDYGIPTSLPWGMSFPNGLVPTTQRVHPTPIYELIVACGIAWFLWRMGSAALGAHPQAKPGKVFAAYLILTGAARFLVEFIRINPRSFLGMSNAQSAAVLSMVAGVILALWFQKHHTTGTR
jgi:phosphatidylglycerol---prolipoprotein diacylglyceryl transferase